MAADRIASVIAHPPDIRASDTPDWQRLYLEEKARRQHLQTLVSGLGDGLVLFDLHFRFVYVNEYTLALLGRAEEEVVGQDFFSLFPDAETTPFGIGLRTALREQRMVDADTFRAQNGKWWRSFIYPTEEGLTVYYRDITHVKAAEAEQFRLDSIVESSMDAIVSRTLDGIITSWNSAAERLFGYSSLEVLGQPISLVFPADHPEDDFILERIRRGERSKPIERVLIRKDKSRLEVSFSLSPIRDSVGSIIGISTIIRDISQQKRYLREREYVMASANCLLWYADVHDDGSEYLRWSSHLVDEDAAQRFLSLDLLPEESYMCAWYRCRIPEDRERCDQFCNSALRAGRGYNQEFRCIGADGVVRWMHENVHVEILEPGRRWRVAAVTMDITDRKLAEAELQASETRFRAVFDNKAVGVVLVTTEGYISVCNQAFEKMLGYTGEELLSKSYVDITHPDDLEADMALARDILAGRCDAYAIEKRYIRKDGSTFWGHLSISAVRDKEEAIRFLVAVVNDITARKEAETTRARQEQERQYVMAAARCLLWYADVYDTGHPDYLGWDIHMTDEDAAQRFLPLDLQEGEAYKDAKYRNRLQDDRAACDRLGTTSIRAGKSYTQEFRCRSADGTIRWLREDIQVETIDFGKHWRVVAVCVDITDQKRLEQQFLQSQKMEGIGRLAGGIAHDFNNLLSVILGYAEMVEMELTEDSDLLPNIQNIQTAATRAAKLTGQLLAFARKQVSEAKVVRLNDLICDMGAILKPLIREDIDLVTLLHEDAGNIKADPHQIEQVIVNLVVNARDAQPNGGKIVLQTSNVRLADHLLREHTTVNPGEYVLLAVSDLGTGMTEEVKGRVFEPFFTTKEVGKGTGLGLATVYGIVKQSAGYIFVYSELGIGTTVKVYLPCVDAPVPAEKNEIRVDASLRGSETILVVEDERLVRELTMTTLRSKGYDVLQAENGQEALRIAEEFAGPIHLMVTDAIMPVMGGKELADRLAAVRPTTQIMYVSGYTEEVTSIQGILPEGTDFLQKPFTAQALLTRVRQALNRSSL